MATTWPSIGGNQMLTYGDVELALIEHYLSPGESPPSKYNASELVSTSVMSLWVSDTISTIASSQIVWKDAVITGGGMIAVGGGGKGG